MFSYLLIKLSFCQTGRSTICKRTHDLLLLFYHIYSVCIIYWEFHISSLEYAEVVSTEITVQLFDYMIKPLHST